MGYHFVGWDTDFTNITNNLDVRPIYEPNTDTPYTINYYKEAIGGLTYELYESVIFYGTSDALVDATFNTYEGFIFNTNHVDKKLSGYVAVDGSLTLNLYYDRVQYDVHFMIIIISFLRQFQHIMAKISHHQQHQMFWGIHLNHGVKR